MVIEAKSIKGSLRGLRYQADDKGMAIEIFRNGLIGDDPKDWHEQMQAWEKNNARVENKRMSIVLAPSKEVSHKLQRDDWNRLVNSYLDKMGIDKEKHQIIAHLHTSTDDKHCHITVSRIPMQSDNLKFVAINDNQIGIRSGTIADKIAKENGWRTAKEIAADKKNLIAEALRASLRTAKNFKELAHLLHLRGFQVNLSQNEAKGVYGMRIVPYSDINANPSERVQNVKEGYKLSEIPKQSGRKATFRINDLTAAFQRNTFNSMSAQDKIAFAENKNEKLFGEKAPQISGESQGTSGKKENSVLETLLKPNYTSPAQDDLLKKRKKKKR